MKKYILGFISALVLIAIIFVVFLFIRGSGDKGPVSPVDLKPEVTDYGILRVEVFGKGKPLADVEVDLGEIGSSGPTGPMSFMVTDAGGLATFENVPVGSYDIFFNTNHFPAGFAPPKSVAVNIVKDQVVQKRIDLAPK